MEQKWRDAVTRMGEMAHAKLTLKDAPAEMHGYLSRGMALVLDGKVWFEEDGETCQVESRDEGRWYSVNGQCDCQAFARAPEHLCKHRAARGIYLRTAEMLAHGTFLAPEEQQGEAIPKGLQIPPQFIQQVHGKNYIRYAGLLHLAHERGLVSLEASLISATLDLALATATATFSDGRVFTEAADATPTNVGAQIKPHFIRMALTRAKARVLRDALNLGDMCAVEEIE